MCIGGKKPQMVVACVRRKLSVRGQGCPRPV